MFYVGVIQLPWPSDLIFILGMYLVANVLILVAIKSRSRNMPDSFELLGDDEEFAAASPMPHTV